MKHLVIGMGEVGRGVATVLGCPGIDKGDAIPEAEVIHICFPFSSDFVSQVHDYVEKTNAKLAIIHSTVQIGTTRACGDFAVHSPIRGKHPHLAESIKTFVKFFGGVRAEEAARYFSDLGIRVVTTLKPENTEAMKLWDTTIFREAILLNKKIYQFCEKHKLDFNIVYTIANETYNEGYAQLGSPQFAKFILKYVDGPIGGHCVEPNYQLLLEIEKLKSNEN